MDIKLYTAVYAIMISFIIGLITCPLLIPILHRLKFGQTERTDGPESHLKKSGTPTMGGIAFIAAFLITSFIFLPFMNKVSMNGLVVMGVTAGFGLIGFIDDYIKVVKKRSLGLKPMQKIIGQSIIAALFAFYIFKYAKIGTDIIIPFTSGITIDLKYLYVPFLFIVLLGTVNGTNLTDGLDGLAGGVTLIITAFLLMVTWAMDVSMMPVCGAMAGGLLSFLIFNAYPARVFMGDTGSLALGGFVASVSLLLKMPLFIIIFGFIYLAESLSVIIQVAVYKKTKKRVFKMAPIHHHFELCGWSETKVVTVFYVVTAMLCLIALLAF